MANEPQRPESDNTPPAEAGGHTDADEMKPAEEWGERLDTGKRIARGGKDHGPVPGAEEAK